MGATSRGIVLLQLVTLLLGASLADRFEKACGQKFGNAREIYQSDGIYVSLLSFRGQQAVIKEARKESSQALVCKRFYLCQHDFRRQNTSSSISGIHGVGISGRCRG
jgi:hypothetical protein